MPQYRLSPAAECDLEDIFEYSMRQWGFDQALLYTEKLESACDLLASNPAAGLDSREIRDGYRRYIVGRHVIYFQPMHYGIAVVRILHGSMDPRFLRSTRLRQ